MRRYASKDPWRCVEWFLAQRPSVFGIVRRHSWSETFAADVQHHRESVIAGIAAHLENTRSEWESAPDSQSIPPPTAPPDPASDVISPETFATIKDSGSNPV